MNVYASAAPPPVDVVLNIFAKPYQTALSILSLLRWSGRHIDRLYLQFEPYGSVHDAAPPYAIAEYLEDRAASAPLGEFAGRLTVFQSAYWLKRDPPDPGRYSEDAYRLSVRYQSAFEHSDKSLLFVMHNDVLILRDIIGALRELAEEDGVFAAGRVGQCWLCPAFQADTMARCGFSAPCVPETYHDFQPSLDVLRVLYNTAHTQGRYVRPYWECWERDYSPLAWPLPECRVNEWACLVRLDRVRPLMYPNGPVPLFGAFEPCCSHNIEIAAPWFRELNRLGLRARHLELVPYLKHWVGTGNKTPHRYAQGEDNARRILERHFPDFAGWCRERRNKLFA